MAFVPAQFIEAKRDGAAHAEHEIDAWIRAFIREEVTDYQMTAWLMAVYLKGLSDPEMVALTRSMLHSGKQIKRPKAGRPRIDKHSTGGVGDKISLPLVGIAAACGLDVPMIAGRGLGHTGGTLDKLESITGYRVNLSLGEFNKVVRRTGASIIGQTADIAPADRRIYALRDVTGTVACRPLIVASILSKKLAAGLDGLVLDVKVGRGAFMKEAKYARHLAKSLVAVASQLGTQAVAVLSNMDQPLGRAIGNSLEVEESVVVLQGGGPKDVVDLTISLVSEMLVLADLEQNKASAQARAEQALASGAAFQRFCDMVELHGGDRRLLEQTHRLPQSKYKVEVVAEQTGYLVDIEPLILSGVAQSLGAGRKRASDTIDPAVGIVINCELGQHIKRGDLLCTLHMNQRAQPLIETARSAFSLGRARGQNSPLILGRIAS